MDAQSTLQNNYSKARIATSKYERQQTAFTFKARPSTGGAGLVPLALSPFFWWGKAVRISLPRAWACLDILRSIFPDIMHGFGETVFPWFMCNQEAAISMKLRAVTQGHCKHLTAGLGWGETCLRHPTQLSIQIKVTVTSLSQAGSFPCFLHVINRVKTK